MPESDIDLPKSFKEMWAIRAVEARELASVGAAMSQFVKGRHLRVIGALAGADYKEKKRLFVPARDKMRVCMRTLKMRYLKYFRRIWRRWNHYERAGRKAKLKELFRKFLLYEATYAFFESEYDDATVIIDAIFSQPRTIKTMIGAEEEEDDLKQDTLLLGSPERLEAKHKAQKMMAKKLGITEKDESPDRFPTFQEALAIAKAQVDAEEGKAELQKPPSKKKREGSKKNKSGKKPAKAKDEKAEKPIRPVFQKTQQA